MTELQKTEFEILKSVIEICEKLNLKYFLVCGSALGAVKYKGFIPWDDDIDIALLREDYLIFCQKAQEFLPSNMFLQNVDTDENYPNIFAKVRNSDTTYIELTSKKIHMNHGVYIDVFPLDGYPDNEKEQLILKRQILKYRLKLLCSFDLPRDATFPIKVLVRIERLLGMHKKSALYVNKLTSIISKYSTKESAIWCNHGNWQGELEYAPREQYGEGICMQFEDITVRVPERYDEYLTQKYGKWRDDLPKEEQVGHHYAAIIDTSNPYTKYIK